MSTLSMQPRIGVPAQVSSFQNRCDLFPGILDKGLNLLRSVAASVQQIRYQIDFITELSKLPANEQFNSNLLEVISGTQSEVNKHEEIRHYNQILADEMTELSNTIDICERTPKTSTTEVTQHDLVSYKNPTHQVIEKSLSESSLRIYNYCQSILPTLYLYRIQGSVLQGRIKTLMDATVKGYNTSSAEFITVSSPVLAAEEIRTNPTATGSSVGFGSFFSSYLPSFLGESKTQPFSRVGADAPPASETTSSLTTKLATTSLSSNTLLDGKAASGGKATPAAAAGQKKTSNAAGNRQPPE